MNEKNGQKIRYDQFYIHDLNERVSVREDFHNWVRHGQGLPSANTGLVSFCDYPFVFNAEAKTLLLQMDALIQMEVSVRETGHRDGNVGVLPCPIFFFLICRLCLEYMQQ